MLKNFTFLMVLACMLSSSFVNAQGDHKLLDSELPFLDTYMANRPATSVGIASVTPPNSSVRTIGEWEELQGFAVTWTTYTSIVREIIRAAREETTVYVICSNAQTVINNLLVNGIDTSNVVCLAAPFNSVWIRDYGPWSAYTNDVDSLITIDWIYNRPRPNDDLVPVVLANQINSPIYQTTTAPWNLVHTGGNFMTDGFGTGFSSDLIDDENSLSGGFGINHTPAEIDTIMNRFMGINRYVRMPKLPYDVIHHIDMHMKLLDEETLLVGQYPTGIADGPQIEANLQYILANYPSVYGTPYKVIRIPMPPDNGAYPNTTGDYFTYTNSSFINKTIIVPTYNIPQDSIALAIYRSALPGYKVVGINSTASIGALGALHCITKELGTSDPLLIGHQALQNTTDVINDYPANFRIQHRSGIQSATLWYTTDTTQAYLPIILNNTSGNNWAGLIPTQPVGTDVYYYVSAIALSGKQQVRPLPAPQGYWKFTVTGTTGFSENQELGTQLKPIYPNPCRGITCIPTLFSSNQRISIELQDILGRTIKSVFQGLALKGDQNYFYDAADLNSGIYNLVMITEDEVFCQKVVVR
jgi:agmatine deiminase